MHTLVIVGSSTGGPEALNLMVRELKSSATFLIIQHMPAFINHSLCEYLEKTSQMTCRVVKDKDPLEAGKIHLAPSSQHLRVSPALRLELFSGEPVNFVCPSADVAMLSVRPQPNVQIVGVVLTGMGKDGAKGIAHLKKIGATTFAQLPSTCSIDSMPKHAIETGCVDQILPIEGIRTAIQRLAAR